MKKEQKNHVSLYGSGDSSGGFQIACFPNECAGAKIVVTDGYDYGSWVKWCGEINEEQYQVLDSIQDMEALRAFVDNL